MLVIDITRTGACSPVPCRTLAKSGGQSQKEIQFNTSSEHHVDGLESRRGQDCVQTEKQKNSMVNLIVVSDNRSPVGAVLACRKA